MSEKLLSSFYPKMLFQKKQKFRMEHFSVINHVLYFVQRKEVDILNLVLVYQKGSVVACFEGN